MFDKKFEDKLVVWHSLREKLETAEDPFRLLIDFYKHAPLTNLSADPWDKKTWASPWELLEENQYCQFGIVLGMCYSLQLTDRFKGLSFEIHISTDEEKSETYYLLFVDEWVLGYDPEKAVHRDNLSESLYSQRVYNMPELH